MDVLKRLFALREARGWTEYELAERSGISQSTISTWYRKNVYPSIPSLEKICEAMGITLSQFFIDESQENIVSLYPAQKKLLSISELYSPEEIEALYLFLKTVKKTDRK